MIGFAASSHDTLRSFSRQFLIVGVAVILAGCGSVDPGENPDINLQDPTVPGNQNTTVPGEGGIPLAMTWIGCDYQHALVDVPRESMDAHLPEGYQAAPSFLPLHGNIYIQAYKCEGLAANNQTVVGDVDFALILGSVLVSNESQLAIDLPHAYAFEWYVSNGTAGHFLETVGYTGVEIIDRINLDQGDDAPSIEVVGTTGESLFSVKGALGPIARTDLLYEQRVHQGPDGRSIIFDFELNSHAAGPNPHTAVVLQTHGVLSEMTPTGEILRGHLFIDESDLLMNFVGDAL